MREDSKRERKSINTSYLSLLRFGNNCLAFLLSNDASHVALDSPSDSRHLNHLAFTCGMPRFCELKWGVLSRVNVYFRKAGSFLERKPRASEISISSFRLLPQSFPWEHMQEALDWEHGASPNTPTWPRSLTRQEQSFSLMLTSRKICCCHTFTFRPALFFRPLLWIQFKVHHVCKHRCWTHHCEGKGIVPRVFPSAGTQIEVGKAPMGAC